MARRNETVGAYLFNCLYVLKALINLNNSLYLRQFYNVCDEEQYSSNKYNLYIYSLRGEARIHGLFFNKFLGISCNATIPLILS